MLRELKRHEWSKFSGKPGTSTARIADALETLASTNNSNEASAAYWLVDGCAFDDDGIYAVALPTVQALLEAIQVCSNVGRPHILELLSQIAARSRADNLGVKCRAELSHGLALFIHWLEAGTIQERSFCVDALFPLASSADDLRDRIIWLLNQAKSTENQTGLDKLIENCVADLNCPFFRS